MVKKRTKLKALKDKIYILILKVIVEELKTQDTKKSKIYIKKCIEDIIKLNKEYFKNK